MSAPIIWPDLFPLKFSKGCDRIALNIHLVIGQDVGHDATSSCESYGLKPLEVVQEILVGVGEIVIKIGSESVIIQFETGL